MNGWGLTISSGYLLLSLLFMLHARSLGNEAIEKQGIDGKVFVSPTPFNVLLWRIVAVDQNNWYSGYFSVRDLNKQVELTIQGNATWTWRLNYIQFSESTGSPTVSTHWNRVAITWLSSTCG